MVTVIGTRLKSPKQPIFASVRVDGKPDEEWTSVQYQNVPRIVSRTLPVRNGNLTFYDCCHKAEQFRLSDSDLEFIASVLRLPTISNTRFSSTSEGMEADSPVYLFRPPIKMTLAVVEDWTESGPRGAPVKIEGTEAKSFEAVYPRTTIHMQHVLAHMEKEEQIAGWH